LKTAIVTGATGFLGTALVRELVKNGLQVYALCRRGSHRISRLKCFENVKIIELDFTALNDVQGISGDIFYHLAWEGGRNDFKEQYKNIAMSIDSVNLSYRLGCKRFVGFGSQAEYGSTTEFITEETPLKPSTSYGACKVATYYLTTDLTHRLEMEFVWARVFSVYGANDNTNSLFPQMLEAFQSKGEFYLMTDGSHIWNYLHEKDVARALHLLGNCESAHGVYNVASRESKSLKHYVEEFSRTVSPTSIVQYGNVKHDVQMQVSTEKLRKCIGEFEEISFYKGEGNETANKE